MIIQGVDLNKFIGLRAPRGKVLIHRFPAEQMTASGTLFIPERAKNKRPRRGIVVARSSLWYSKTGFPQPHIVSVGDEVIYAQWTLSTSVSGVPEDAMFSFGDERLIIADEYKDIYAVIEREYDGEPGIVE